MAVLVEVIGVDRTLSHRLIHLMYPQTPPQTHTVTHTYMSTYTPINHPMVSSVPLAFSAILQHWLWARGYTLCSTVHRL